MWRHLVLSVGLIAVPVSGGFFASEEEARNACATVGKKPVYKGCRLTGYGVRTDPATGLLRREADCLCKLAAGGTTKVTVPMD